MFPLLTQETFKKQTRHHHDDYIGFFLSFWFLSYIFGFHRVTQYPSDTRIYNNPVIINQAFSHLCHILINYLKEKIFVPQIEI